MSILISWNDQSYILYFEFFYDDNVWGANADSREVGSKVDKNCIVQAEYQTKTKNQKQSSSVVALS